MTSNKFKNKKKGAFLVKVPDTGLGNGEITKRCKFNFSYFDKTQPAGQDFSDWSYDDLIKLLSKIKNYSESPLEFWRHERCGGAGLKILEIYDDFPKKSNFIHPKHVPYNVSWARFRMENLVRLVGFIVPRGFKCNEDVKLTEPFDSNTFYVVFLDKEHKFYLTEDA